MVNIWRFVRGGPQVLARIFLPPPAFKPLESERAFLAEHARRTAPQRRAGIFLALFIWVAYSGLDFLNVGPGSGAETLYPKIVFLRILGFSAMSIGGLLALRESFLNSNYAERITFLFVVACYLVLLAMVTNLVFPFSYIIDYPGLILYILFVLGLFRMGSRTFLAIIFIILPVTTVVLYLSNTASLGSPHQFLTMATQIYLRDYSDYYYVTTMVYLTSAMVVGIAIAGQLERDSRAAFLRERQLERSNQDLVESRRDVENKTVALITAKEELRASAERENLNKSKFLADAAHDLSQPTHAVGLFTDAARLALAHNDYGRAVTLIESAGRAAQIARSSFDAVMEISKLQSGLIKPTLSIFNVRDLIAEVEASLRIIAESRGVHVRVRPARDDGAMVRSDRDLLGRAVINLAVNAVKYSDSAKGERRTVLIGVVPLSERVRIDVVDNGVGIPKERWAEIFMPFVQLRNPGHDREQGLGLGLSIFTATMALLPDHRHAMHSREGRGTRFSVEAPRYSGWSGTPAELRSRWRDATELQSLFVWHVEDDDLSRMATSAFLRELGILSEQANSVEELQRKLQSAERCPDLVITDHRLPLGYTANDVIDVFAQRWQLELPVMILTGDAAPVGLEFVGRRVEVLRKPAGPAEIIEAIRRLCSKDASGPVEEE